MNKYIGKANQYYRDVVGEMRKVVWPSREEIKDLTMTELTAKGRDLRQELFNLRLQKASSQLEKPSRMRILRRDIARMETQMSFLRRKAA